MCGVGLDQRMLDTCAQVRLVTSRVLLSCVRLWCYSNPRFREPACASLF